MRIALAVRKISSNVNSTLKFHRTYIPKREKEPLGIGNARPLGVPKPE
jgi:hypothetical protein